MHIRDYLNQWTPSDVDVTDDIVTFTFQVEDNPDLADYKVRNAIVAKAVAHYPRCAQGVTSLNDGVVTMKFVRAFA